MKLIPLWVALYLGSIQIVTAQELREVKKVVFLGDSITEAGAAEGGYVSLLRESLGTKYPEIAWKVIGAGISGNKVPDVQNRLDRDVLKHNPDLVVIYIGINDVWHSQNGNGTDKDAFRAGLTDVIARIRNAKSKVLLCTPSVIGEKTDGSNSLDEMLNGYSEISREVARETGVQLLDLRRAFIRELRIANKDNRESGVLTSDGVHLNPAGNQFVCDVMRPVVHSVATGDCIRHMVLFRFRETATAAQINHVSDEFVALGGKIPQIMSLDAGVDISPESLSQGYTHAFLVTFADAMARDEYLVHPAHQEFVGILADVLDSALVVDFVGNTR